ncbi:TPA: hypothetical protein KOU56_003520 [Clostridioides difficile]|nr:hypothetical protein [Clostridioides difficile]
MSMIMVANVDEEEMIFRTEIKKLEEGNEVIVYVNGIMKVAIFKRFIDKCEGYIKDIAFQKVDLNRYKEAVEKDNNRIKNEFKGVCIMQSEFIISEEIDDYLRMCKFNYDGNKFTKYIDDTEISIYKKENKNLLQISSCKNSILTKIDITNKDLTTIIKIMNKYIFIV